MNNATELYEEALHITETSDLQRKVFAYQFDHADSLLSFDTETTGVTFHMPSILHLNEHTDIVCNNVTIFGISLCMEYEENLAIVWGRIGNNLFDSCVNLLTSPCLKCAHNLRYDLRVCEANDIIVNGKLHDTLTMARLHWNRRKKFDLKELTSIIAPDMYGYEDELKATIRNIKSTYTRAGYPKGYVNYSFVPNEIVSEYSMRDAFITWLLCWNLKPYTYKEHKEVYQREMKVLHIVKNMESRGLQLSRIITKKEIRKIEIKIPKLKESIDKLIGKNTNVNSPIKLIAALKDIGVTNVQLRRKGKITTARPVLEKILITEKDKKIISVIKHVLDFRTCNKLLSTYLKVLYKRAAFNKGIIYCNVNPADTRTGRMTSNDPNLHNIPRPITVSGGKSPVRKCFVCRPGYTNYFLDYEQMEMWLFALLANEKVMLQALRSGKDVHAQTAISMFGDSVYDDNGNVKPEIRLVSKRINFGIIYGMGVQALAMQIKTSMSRAHNLREQYYNTYPSIFKFMHKCKKDLHKYGYVQDIFGRRYSIEPTQAYKCINALVQGSCAQIMKIALIQQNELINILPTFNLLRIHILMVIHDEVIIEIPTSAGKYAKPIIVALAERMCDIQVLRDLDINLGIDIKYSTKSWEDKKDVFTKEEKSELAYNYPIR